MQHRFGTCIFAFSLLIAALAFGGESQSPTTQPSFLLGRLTHPPLCESSGIVASRKHPGVFWTQNDSGNAAVLYAVTSRGELIAEYPVKAFDRDWEDLAIDDAGHLYIAETGNNQRRENQIAVYQVDEPEDVGQRLERMTATRATTRPMTDVAVPPPAPLVVRHTWQLRYPGRPFDCEALFVHDGRGYLISKLLDGERARIYRFDLVVEQKNPATLEPLIDLPIHFPVTAADLSPDAKHLAVMTIAGPYLLHLAKAGDIASAAKAEPIHVEYFRIDMEAVCFVREGLLATTESRDVLLFGAKQFSSDGEWPQAPSFAAK